MADDKTKTGKPDRDRINVSEKHEVRDWARKFAVSEEEVRAAVKKAGPMAKDVATALGKRLSVRARAQIRDPLLMDGYIRQVLGHRSISRRHVRHGGKRNEREADCLQGACAAGSPVTDTLTTVKMLDDYLDQAYAEDSPQRDHARAGTYYMMRCVLDGLETIDETMRDRFNRITA